MRLPIIPSFCLVVALAAPASLAADAKPAGESADKPVALTVPTPQTLKWPRPKRWYKPEEQDAALSAARLLGRPVAIAWYVEGRPKSNVGLWKGSDIAKYCVGLSVTEKVIETTAEGKLRYTMTHPLVTQIYKGSGLGKVRAPCLFIATWKGKHLGVIQRNVADKNAVNAAVKEIVKEYGKLLNTNQALSAWKNLMAARKLWHAGKHDAAMKHYRKVMSLASVNARMDIAAELNKDARAIDAKGATELKVAEKQIKDGELDRAEAELRRIHNKYEGFDTDATAKLLFKSILEAREEGAVAAKEIKKDPADGTPKKPAADDKPAVADKKNDSNDRADDDDEKDAGNDEKDSDEDEEYEDDF